jgi:transposase
MSEYSKVESGWTIGLDLGDRFSYYLVVGPGGELVSEGRVETRMPALQRLFTQWVPARVAIEVGTHSRWVSRLLEGLGHEVLVANARQVRLIYGGRTKNDQLDAQHLARLARLDVRLLSPIRHRGEEAQRDLTQVRSRAQLVKARTQLINHVRMTVKAAGQRLVSCGAESFARRAGVALGEEFSNLAPVLRMIESLNVEIRHYEREIEALCEGRYPETQGLRKIRGVGPLTALSYVLTLDDPGRFHRSRQVGAYLGLSPRRSQSGDRNPQLRITKAGDRMLRGLLINAAHYLLGPFGEDSDLRRYGERIAARGGKNAKKRAVVAVARKLSVLMHHLWVTGKTYEPLYHAGRQAA